MENKITENPNGIAFMLTAYNAKAEGGWIDLLNSNNNALHVDYLKICPEVITKDIGTIIVQFPLGVDHLRTIIEINGCQFMTGRMFSPMQYQRDIISIDNYISKIKSLRIFLPFQTYSVGITAIKADQQTDYTKPFPIGDQYCIRVKNMSSQTRSFDILNPDVALKALYDVSILLTDRITYSKVRIFSNTKENQRNKIHLVFKDEGVEQFLSTNGMSMYQFQDGVQDYEFTVPIPFKELQNFFVDLYPGEEAMFYFYN